MISTFPDLLKTTGAKLLDPIGFSKYKGQRIYEIPEIYWQRYCTQNGVNHTVILNKIIEAKEELRNLQQRQVRRKLDPEKIRHEFELNGEIVKLMAHQVEYAKLNQDTKGSLLAADIGTGKTFAILEIIRLRWMPYDKCLILCPPNVFSSWQKALDDFFYKKSTHITISGSAKERLNLLNFNRNFYIANYESVSRVESVREKLKQMGFTWLICDEADEYLCNPSTKNWKTVMELSANIDMRFILTGTPRRQKDDSLYGLVTFIDRGERFGVSYEKFKDKFMLKELPNKFLKERFTLLQAKGKLSKKEAHEYMRLKGMMLTRLNPAYEKEFHQKLNSIMYRVNKRDVLDLPPLTYEIIQIELTGQAKEKYLEMRKHSIIEIDNYCKLTGDKKQLSVEAGIALARIMKLRQISCGYVHDTATGETVDFEKDKLNYLSNLLDRINEPVIITCVHTKEIKDIERLCKEKKLKYGIIAGAKSTNKKDIEIAMQAFSLGKLDVLISQEKAGRAGIDGLQLNCSLMVEYSYGYSATTHDQKVGRLERKGQRNPMTLITFEAVINQEELIDRAIIETIKNGKDGFDYLIQNIKKLNKNLT